MPSRRALSPDGGSAPLPDLALPAPELAPLLLGCRLRSGRGATLVEAVICETEAYQGAEDLACHAARGRTPRTAVTLAPTFVPFESS